MTKTSEADASSPSQKASTDLLQSSIKFFHIVLMVTAAAAPLVVVAAYIPISLSSGAGLATALTYGAATVILFIFSVGFVQMAKRITAAGAFYTFTSQGLGRPAGLATGFTIAAAYSMISAAIQGGFGFYASALLRDYFGVNVAWYWCSIVALILMFAISYYRVTFTARILGVLLTLEVLIVLIVDFFIIGSGGASGQMLSAFNPTQWAAAPAIGIGFFLAFWSWIGFETTAIYGEETKDPKESVPRATYISVLTLGVFYTLAAYAAIVGFGNNSPEKASALGGQYFFQLAEIYSVPFIRTAMDFLVVSGFFACSFAFHNNAARYFYSLGRDRILPRILGTTHPKHKSPHIAAGVQAAIAIITVAIFAIGGADPLLQLGTWLPIFCTLAVILVQLLVSVAVVGYFNRVGRLTRGDYLKTLVAPVVGALAQLAVIVLLLKNLTFLAGSDVLVVTLIPVYVALIAIAGFLYALWLRKKAPARFAAIGELREEDFVDVLPDDK